MQTLYVHYIPQAGHFCTLFTYLRQGISAHCLHTSGRAFLHIVYIPQTGHFCALFTYLSQDISVHCLHTSDRAFLHIVYIPESGNCCDVSNFTCCSKYSFSAQLVNNTHIPLNFMTLKIQYQW